MIQDMYDEIGLRHEDCSCEACLLRLEEHYEDAREHSFKRPELCVWNESEDYYLHRIYHDEDLGEGC